MGSIATIILSALGALPSVLDALKALFTDVAGLFDSVGVPKAGAVADQASSITASIEADLATAQQWFTAEFPTIEALLAVFPGLPKLMYSATNIVADQGVTLHTALTAAQLGANSVKVAQAAKP